MIAHRLILRFLLSGVIALTAMSLNLDRAQAADTAADMPDVVMKGLANYAQSGAEAALQTWIAGGPLENEDYMRSQATGLHRIEAFFGKYQGYEPIRVSAITSRIRAVYLVMHFEKGPAFCYMLCYQTSGGQWVVSDFDGSTSPRRILPEYGATSALPSADPAAVTNS